VKESNINSSTKKISDNIQNLVLAEEDVLISFDVTSLYTNVPVIKAVEDCTKLLFSGRYKLPPADRETFKQLLMVCSSNVLMLTNDGYFRQTDGSMGSLPAPLIANCWMSKFDSQIKDDAMLYERYMDDILRNINKSSVNTQKARRY